MKHLFSAWAQVASRIEGASNIFLFSDYDGTLTPIVATPDLARLSEGVRHQLQALASHPRYTVGLISGRSLKDLKGRVGVSSILYAGNHGLEIEGPGLAFTVPLAEETKPILSALHQALGQALASVPGALAEHKGLTLSVHYRLVPEGRVDEVQDIFQRLIAPYLSQGKVRTTAGKKVYEVRPAMAWDKGKAIGLLLDKSARRGGLPIYLGDDLTDEDGFRAVAERDGISIFVGEAEHPSTALYFLRSPQEVEEFLSRLLSGNAGAKG